MTGQSAPAAFDVASIKPASGRPRGLSNTFLAGGRYVADASTLRGMISFAYRPLLPSQIVGGPDWMNSAQYSITAKGSGNPSVETLRLMLRQLLAERFKLRAHMETRETQVYALVQPRADGPRGPRLTPSSTDCSEYADGVPPPDQVPTLRFEHCGFRMMTRNHVGTGIEGILLATGVTMRQLAEQLPAGRVVVDRTGLGGAYDLELSFAISTAAGATLDAPSVFTAVQEQLGLKLESATAPVDFLIIDGAERPVPD